MLDLGELPGLPLPDAYKSILILPLIHSILDLTRQLSLPFRCLINGAEDYIGLVIASRPVLRLQIVKVVITSLVFLKINGISLRDLEPAPLRHDPLRSMHLLKLILLLLNMVLYWPRLPYLELLGVQRFLPIFVELGSEEFVLVDGFLVVLVGCILEGQVGLLFPLAHFPEALLNEHLVG